MATKLKMLMLFPLPQKKNGLLICCCCCMPARGRLGSGKEALFPPVLVWPLRNLRGRVHQESLNEWQIEGCRFVANVIYNYYFIKCVTSKLFFGENKLSMCCAKSEQLLGQRPSLVDTPVPVRSQKLSNVGVWPVLERVTVFDNRVKAVIQKRKARWRYLCFLLPPSWCGAIYH